MRRLFPLCSLVMALTTAAAAQHPAPSAAPRVLSARPAPVAFEPGTTAVLVVDMQNDFGSPGGMFDRAGVDISQIQRAVAPTAAVLAAARRAGLPVIYLKMGYREDLADLGNAEAPNRVRHLQYMRVGDTMTAPTGKPARILVRGHWGTDIVAALQPAPADVVLYKTRYSGFYQTELDAVLKKRGIRTLVVTGCTTSVCVESTVRDAMFRDYHAVVLADCTAEPLGNGLPRSNYEASLLLMETLLGWVSTSADFIGALAPQPPAGSAKQARSSR